MTNNPDFQMIVRMVENKPCGSVHLSRERQLFPICGFPHPWPDDKNLPGIWQVDFVGPVTCERCKHIAAIRPELLTPPLPGLERK